MPPQNLHLTLPQNCAPRLELLRLFEECAKRQFIYVQAPAGYGKTISTLLWLQKSQRAFTWIFLDKYDNMLSLFYRSLCRSLLDLCRPGLAKSSAPGAPLAEDTLTRYLNDPLFAASPIESALQFVSMLSWSEGPCALVLDDLHLIDNEEILKSLPYFLKRLPALMNVALLSRATLPASMRVLIENDKTSFIGLNELTFSAEEIRNHFRGYGRFITREKADTIYSFTDGWVIILNAMLQSGNTKLSYENHKFSLEDYFEKNIWNGLDEATRIFLLKTAVVDSFTLELCELLTKNPAGAQILDTLIKGNINLSRMGQEYRYHNLFLDFLRERLPISGIDQNELLFTAAHYYLKAGQFHKAAIYSMRQNDPRLKIQVIQTFFQSKNPALEQFLELSLTYNADKLPPEAFERAPILYMPAILAAYLTGETAQTEGLFDRFYAALPAFIAANHPLAAPAAGRLLLDHRLKLAGILPFMSAMGLSFEQKIEGQAAVVTVQLPMLHRSVRDFYEFLDPDTKAAVYNLFACLLPGDNECFYHGVTAGLLMERNRLNEALEEALCAYHGLTADTGNEVYFGVCIGLAEIYSLKSAKDRSQSILKGLRQWIEDKRALYLLKNLEAYEKRLLMWDGSLQAAQEWLENYYISDAAAGEFYKIYQNFTSARAYIMLDLPDKATAMLEQMKKLGFDMDRPLDVAEADVLLALTEWILGKKEAARDRLCHVLKRLRQYGFMRVVANEGKSVLPILTAVLKKLEGAQEEALYRFTKEVQMAAYEQSKRYSGLTSALQPKPVKLSPQQTLVLELLAQGHNNKEIVKITGLSINTIREHTRAAYRKLEVTNVMDALIKSKQLGILK